MSLKEAKEKELKEKNRLNNMKLWWDSTNNKKSKNLRQRSKGRNNKRSRNSKNNRFSVKKYRELNLNVFNIKNYNYRDSKKKKRGYKN